MAATAPAQEPEDPLSHNIGFVPGIAYGSPHVWGQVWELLLGHLPMADLACHRHRGRLLVDSLHVRIQHCTQPSDPTPPQPHFLYCKPYVHIFVVDCLTPDSYTYTWRQNLHEWVAAKQAALEEWLIVYAPQSQASDSKTPSVDPSQGRPSKSWRRSFFTLGGAAAASPAEQAKQNREAVWERLFKDFGTSSKLALGGFTLSYDKTRARDMCVAAQPRVLFLEALCRGPGSDAADVAQHRAQQWQAFVDALGTTVMCTLDQRLTFLEHLVADNLSRCQRPGWNVMDFVLQKECLAFMYASVRLPDNALRQYLEIGTVFRDTAQAQAPFYGLHASLTSHLSPEVVGFPPRSATAPTRPAPSDVRPPSPESSKASLPRKSWWSWRGKSSSPAKPPLPSEAPPAPGPPSLPTGRPPAAPSQAKHHEMPQSSSPSQVQHLASLRRAPATQLLLPAEDDCGLAARPADAGDVGSLQAQHGISAGPRDQAIFEAQAVLAQYFHVHTAHGLVDGPVVPPPDAHAPQSRAAKAPWLPVVPSRHLLDVSLRSKPYRREIMLRTITAIDFWRYLLARQASLQLQTKRGSDLAVLALQYVRFLQACNRLHVAQGRLRPLNAAAWEFCSALDAVEVAHRAVRHVRMPPLISRGAENSDTLEQSLQDAATTLQGLLPSALSCDAAAGRSSPASCAPGSPVTLLSMPGSKLLGQTQASVPVQQYLSAILADLLGQVRTSLALCLMHLSNELRSVAAPQLHESLAPDTSSLRSASATVLLGALWQDAQALKRGDATTGFVGSPATTSLYFKLTALQAQHLCFAGHKNAAAGLLVAAAMALMARGMYEAAWPLVGHQAQSLARRGWHRQLLVVLILQLRCMCALELWRPALQVLWRLLMLLTPVCRALYLQDGGGEGGSSSGELELLLQSPRGGGDEGSTSVAATLVFGGGVVRSWRDLLFRLLAASTLPPSAAIEGFQSPPEKRSRAEFPTTGHVLSILWQGLGFLAQRLASSSVEGEAPPPSFAETLVPAATTVVARPLIRSAVSLESLTPCEGLDAHGGACSELVVQVGLLGAGDSLALQGVPVDQVVLHLQRFAEAPPATATSHVLSNGKEHAALPSAVQPHVSRWTDSGTGSAGSCCVEGQTGVLVVSPTNPMALSVGASCMVRVKVPPAVLPAGKWAVRSVRLLCAGRYGPAHSLCGVSLVDQFPVLLHGAAFSRSAARLIKPKDLFDGHASIRAAELLPSIEQSRASPLLQDERDIQQPTRPRLQSGPLLPSHTSLQAHSANEAHALVERSWHEHFDRATRGPSVQMASIAAARAAHDPQLRPPPARLPRGKAGGAAPLGPAAVAILDSLQEAVDTTLGSPIPLMKFAAGRRDPGGRASWLRAICSGHADVLTMAMATSSSRSSTFGLNSVRAATPKRSSASSASFPVHSHDSFVAEPAPVRSSPDEPQVLQQILALDGMPPIPQAIIDALLSSPLTVTTSPTPPALARLAAAWEQGPLPVPSDHQAGMPPFLGPPFLVVSDIPAMPSKCISASWRRSACDGLASVWLHVTAEAPPLARGQAFLIIHLPGTVGNMLNVEGCDVLHGAEGTVVAALPSATSEVSFEWRPGSSAAPPSGFVASFGIWDSRMAGQGGALSVEMTNAPTELGWSAVLPMAGVPPPPRLLRVHAVCRRPSVVPAAALPSHFSSSTSGDSPAKLDLLRVSISSRARVEVLAAALHVEGGAVGMGCERAHSTLQRPTPGTAEGLMHGAVLGEVDERSVLDLPWAVLPGQPAPTSVTVWLRTSTEQASHVETLQLAW